jgi:predicted RNA-binding protein YlxR (DUF448 family)
VTEPVRTCVGCRQAAGRRGLLRLVRNPAGVIVVDRTGRTHGRGAYLHLVSECVALARKRRALERALKTAVPDSVWDELNADLAE